MAYRALVSGRMIEVSGGETEGPDGKVREVTQIVMSRQGQIYNDISRSMRDRYAEQDPSMLELVEYGEVVTEVNDEGEPTSTFVPQGVGAANEVEVDSDVLERAETAEGKVTELTSKVTELEAQLAQASRAADAATQASDAAAADAQSKIADLERQLQEKQDALDAAELEAAGGLSYNDLSPEALEAEVAHKKLTVTGTGANGNVLKKDNVAALEEANKPS